MPDIAILFWFYKEVDICENRLQLLKKTNPDAKIYGLYGGPQESVSQYEEKLSPYLDDFYTSPILNSEWKWRHGDLVILEWYQSRGKNLSWDSIAIIQWDMLVFDSIQSVFSEMKKGEIFLSGLRDLTKDVEGKWWYTREDTHERKNYLAFLEQVKKNYGFEKTPPLVCQFILEIFPRNFFEKYETVADKEIGMLEYKIPAYAEIFNIPFFKKDIGVAWEELGDDFHNSPLNASPRGELSPEYIQSELSKPAGWRIFHPHPHIWHSQE